LESLNVLNSLRNTPNYTNMVKEQHLVLFTDGLEEKDKHIPFTKTIELFKLYSSSVPFKFEKYFIIPDGGAVPEAIKAESDALVNAGFAPIKIGRAKKSFVEIKVNDAKLSGTLKEPEDFDAAANVELKPEVLFKVTADGVGIKRGRLVFVLSSPPGLEAEVTPGSLSVEQMEQPVQFSIKLKGKMLPALFETDMNVTNFEWLKLTWELRGYPENSLSASILPEENMMFFGTNCLPISLELVPGILKVQIRHLKPADARVAANLVEIHDAPREGDLAVFEADFPKTWFAAAIEVSCKSTENNYIQLASTREDKLLLTGGDQGGKKTFSLTVDAPAGASEAQGVLCFASQSPRLAPIPTNITVRAIFQPAVITVSWQNQNGDTSQQPAEIDFKKVYMPSIEAGTAEVVEKPPVCELLVEVPSKAISPALECRLTGTNADAFRIIAKGDAGGEAHLIHRTVRLEVQPKHVHVKVTRPLETNMTACLEIRPCANFVFQTTSPAAKITTNLISVPLKMNVLIQPWEGDKNIGK